MRSSGINGGELRGQLVNPGSPEKWPLKQCVCVCGPVKTAGAGQTHWLSFMQRCKCSTAVNEWSKLQTRNSHMQPTVRQTCTAFTLLAGCQEVITDFKKSLPLFPKRFPKKICDISGPTHRNNKENRSVEQKPREKECTFSLFITFYLHSATYCVNKKKHGHHHHQPPSIWSVI